MDELGQPSVQDAVWEHNMNRQQPRYAPFRLSEPKAHITEAAVLASFKACGWEGAHDGDKCRRDFWIAQDGIQYWVEVKDETAQGNTPNLCLEFGQGRPLQPSGLSACEAQIWVNVFEKDCAIFRARPMISFVRAKVADGVYKEHTGGDNNNRYVLVPRAAVLMHPWFQICDLADIGHSSIFLRL